MANFQEIAQLLISSWALNDNTSRIPVTHGALDRALKAVKDEGLLPDWAAQELHFADTRVGLRCVETPDLLEWAQLGLLTSVPNPTYQFAEVQLDRKTALRLLEWLNVPEDQARRIGTLMGTVVKAELTEEASEVLA
jgi:hypothetical protein